MNELRKRIVLFLYNNFGMLINFVILFSLIIHLVLFILILFIEKNHHMIIHFDLLNIVN